MLEVNGKSLPIVIVLGAQGESAQAAISLYPLIVYRVDRALIGLVDAMQLFLACRQKPIGLG